MSSSPKLERYARVRDQIADLIRAVSDPIARRATAVALLHHKVPGVSWTGFYMLRDGALVVDVYQGPLACLVLQAHQGVCWAAIDRAESIIVPDVHAFAGHIPCDSRTRSEIVVPFREARGVVVGVLDLDSHRLDHFDTDDQKGLESIVRVLETT